MKRLLVFCLILSASLISAAPTREQLNAYDAEATVKAQSIVRNLVRPGMTEFEKALVLHEYITDTVTYAKWNGMTSAYTALEHQTADCVGFARGLDRLYTAAGLESFVVVRKKGHLWVKVRVRGTYYNVDATWSAVKSRWPQYNWFLLSDAQNVDDAKGVDHILDSGETYDAAPDEFTLIAADYPNRKLLRSPQKLRIMGTVSLPAGDIAPAGGIAGTVGRTRFFIPEGKRTAFYIASIERTITTAPVLRVRMSRDPENRYIADTHYARNALIPGSIGAHRFDLSADDSTGVDFSLLPRSTGSATRPARPVFPRVDRLAADARAARYRTGIIDPAVEAAPVAVQNDLFANPGEQTVRAFITALMRGTADPFVKAKRIHDWMTLFIAYDSDLLNRLNTRNPNGSVEPLGVLQYRRSNCEGLARLYEMLARAAGLEARYITGFIKRSENRSGNLTSHAWNLVRIDGTDYIVDCSADTRIFWNAGKNSKMMDYDQKDDHLFVHPEAKRIGYLAHRPEDQLCTAPLSPDAFRSAPRFEPALYKYGLEPESLSSRNVFRDEKKSGGADLYDLFMAPDGVLELRFRAPSDVYIQAALADDAGKEIRDRAFAERGDGTFSCRFVMPVAGSFRGTITARSLAEPNRVNMVYQFRISAARPGKTASIPGTITSYYAPLQGVSLDRIYRDMQSGTLIAEISHPADVKVISFVRDSKEALIAKAVRTEAGERGTRFEYTLPGIEGLQIIIAGAPVPDTAQRGNQRMFTIAAGSVK
jgi:transglutaminase-like putative cysteine protease